MIVSITRLPTALAPSSATQPGPKQVQYNLEINSIQFQKTGWHP